MTINKKILSLIRDGICIAFVIAGLALGYYLVKQIWLEYLEVKEWTEVPASILSSELVVTKGRRNSRFYRVKAEYEYEYEGRKYRGSRVTVMGLADSSHEKHHNRNQELTQHLESGKPFRCFVNPEVPEESILYRTIGWTEFFYVLLIMSVYFTFWMFLFIFMVLLNTFGSSVNEKKNEEVFKSTLEG